MANSTKPEPSAAPASSLLTNPCRSLPNGYYFLVFQPRQCRQHRQHPRISSYNVNVPKFHRNIRNFRGNIRKFRLAMRGLRCKTLHLPCIGVIFRTQVCLFWVAAVAVVEISPGLCPPLDARAHSPTGGAESTAAAVPQHGHRGTRSRTARGARRR